MIEKLHEEAKAIAASTHRGSKSIRLSEMLHMKMIEVGNKHRFTVGEMYDMAALMILRELGADLSSYERIAPVRVAKNKKAVDNAKQCGSCYIVYDSTKHDDCPYCE